MLLGCQMLEKLFYKNYSTDNQIWNYFYTMKKGKKKFVFIGQCWHKCDSIVDKLFMIGSEMKCAKET